MENKINIAELLKDCPKGMELDCTMYEYVTLIHIIEDHIYPIKINTPDGLVSLTKYGCYSQNKLSKCIIFPKGQTTWEGFQRPFKNGDIVTWKDRGAFVACIYKERKNTSSFYHHIALYKGGVGIIVNSEIALMDNQLRLATEEEKQKLFDAIKANGYRWNAETKTLEKLIEPKFKVGDRVKVKQRTIRGEILDVCRDKYVVKIDGKGLSVYFCEQDDWELDPHKFDITTLKPFDRVLVRDNDEQMWTADMFSFYNEKHVYPFMCVGHYTNQCIPYDQNKHLLGTTNKCEDFYKTWK